ncbi:hypothetical protein WR25_15002 [Diploscapter pachys]|uniref:Uncharacterized protein n=1 Tax=Diploscapter pachys TaxID=2018661 RepID=A0A2A2K8M3_9BILA|nr:hypothetical protein WR25_15002 [Diploscapter pachys]
MKEIWQRSRSAGVGRAKVDRRAEQERASRQRVIIDVGRRRPARRCRRRIGNIAIGDVVDVDAEIEARRGVDHDARVPHHIAAHPHHVARPGLLGRIEHGRSGVQDLVEPGHVAAVERRVQVGPVDEIAEAQLPAFVLDAAVGADDGILLDDVLIARLHRQPTDRTRQRHRIGQGRLDRPEHQRALIDVRLLQRRHLPQIIRTSAAGDQPTVEVVRIVGRIVAPLQYRCRRRGGDDVAQIDADIIRRQRQPVQESGIEDAADGPGRRLFVLQVAVADDRDRHGRRIDQRAEVRRNARRRAILRPHRRIGSGAHVALIARIVAAVIGRLVRREQLGDRRSPPGSVASAPVSVARKSRWLVIDCVRAMVVT